MLRRSCARLGSFTLMYMQMDTSNPLTPKDKPVNSFHDEFLKPPVSQAMISKYGPYAKYTDPSLVSVDTTEEVVLNTYPDGQREGRIEVVNGIAEKDFQAGTYDEKFFRKHILLPRPTQTQAERRNVVDYAMSSLILGFLMVSARQCLLPFWYLGMPNMRMVGTMNIEAEIGEMFDRQCRTIVWRGKPIFVYHRSEYQMSQMENLPMSSLKHPETDVQRFPHPEHRRQCVVIGICTHLGCIPQPNEGNYDGFFCPCHGSHYDCSGRIRQGPAPLNLELPPMKWVNANTLYVGTL